MAFKDLFKRQSSPRPTIEEASRQINERIAKQQGIFGQRDALSLTSLAYQMPRKLVIDTKRVEEASAILKKYKDGKANLDAKIVENEQWYKLRHWEQMRKTQEEDVEPVSAWLFNTLANKHADAMDNFPSPNILPREEGDKAEAKTLTSIIPVILDQNGFKKTYSKVMHHKNRSGTGVYGVYWESSKHNGLGDVTVNKVDLLNLYWEAGITDIQDSRNVFHISLQDNDILEQSYPQLKGQLTNATIDVKTYIYDDTVDTSQKSVVVDWYYKKQVGTKTILHYCKFVNNIVLFATENETQPITDELGNIVRPPMSETGLYDHGKYPFVFDVLYPMEGTPAGFGYIDIGKNTQSYIDRGNQAILMNMLANARPRFFAKEGAGVNIEEFADVTKDIVHVEGNLDGAVQAIPSTPMSSLYQQVIHDKIDELKETTGNRDISTGGTTSGVTAASAIAAMQEAGSKLSRDNNSTSYEAFKEVCLLIIELIRQFYDVPRFFRVMGVNGAESFIPYSNANLVAQSQGNEMGVDTGTRLPLFDIEITAQKQSPYTKMSQNELALQLYKLGFFNPQMADQALACLEMMDFDRKDFVMQKVVQNQLIFQQMMLMAQAQATPSSDKDTSVENTEALGGKEGAKESATTSKARERVAESTSPR